MSGEPPVPAPPRGFPGWLGKFIRQPTTLMAAGCLLGAAVYWQTRSPELALASAAIIPGAVNDHTTTLLAKIEALEDEARGSKS